VTAELDGLEKAIIQSLEDEGSLGFNELLREMVSRKCQVSRGSLSRRLKRLVELELVAKEMIPGWPPSTRYRAAQSRDSVVPSLQTAFPKRAPLLVLSLIGLAMLGTLLILGPKVANGPSAVDNSSREQPELGNPHVSLEERSEMVLDDSLFFIPARGFVIVPLEFNTSGECENEIHLRMVLVSGRQVIFRVYDSESFRKLNQSRRGAVSPYLSVGVKPLVEPEYSGGIHRSNLVYCHQFTVGKAGTYFLVLDNTGFASESKELELSVSHTWVEPVQA